MGKYLVPTPHSPIKKPGQAGKAENLLYTLLKRSELLAHACPVYGETLKDQRRVVDLQNNQQKHQK